MGIGRSRVIGARVSALAAMLALLASPGTASAQNWPTRPLTLVVPFAAGGPSDVTGRRIIAKEWDAARLASEPAEKVGTPAGW